jgi:pimeloyl-ACP methyl ester carboxylesterase
VTVTCTQMTPTAKGTLCCTRVWGPDDGVPVVYFHAATGLLDDEAFFTELAGHGMRIYAPELPGWGESTGEQLLEDMLDFALHGWDLVDALGIDRPVLIGHSMGGMIAAEMASVCPQRPRAVVLVAPNGLWDDSRPFPDLFSLLPQEFPSLLFSDEAAGAALLTNGVNFDDREALAAFLVSNSRRLGTAGKILFPVPNRRLSKRLYRLTAPTLLVWGESDGYIPRDYANQWLVELPSAKLETLPSVGHMVPYEAPGELAQVTAGFLQGVPGVAVRP